MRALKEKNYPTKTAAIAYATDDVISKTMGEKVLPTLMQKAGTEIKLNVTFSPRRSISLHKCHNSSPNRPISLVSGPDQKQRCALSRSCVVRAERLGRWPVRRLLIRNCLG